VGGSLLEAVVIGLEEEEEECKEEEEEEEGEERARGLMRGCAGLDGLPPPEEKLS